MELELNACSPPSSNLKKRKIGEMSGFSHEESTRVSKRHHNLTSSAIRYLEGLQMVRIQRPRRQAPFKIRVGRPLSLNQMRLVLYLRFRSLSSDSFKWHTPREVFERTGVGRSS